MINAHVYNSTIIAKEHKVDVIGVDEVQTRKGYCYGKNLLHFVIDPAQNDRKAAIMDFRYIV